MMNARAVVARLAARAAAVLGRLFGKSGTSLPGRVMLAIDPGGIRRLAGSIPRGTVAISATNGKTTTAALASAALRSAGLHPVHNAAGANMAGGIASALLADRGLAEPESIGLFEVDEAWLPSVAEQVSPSHVVLGNLFRDQLDRYGELDSIVDEWSRAARALARDGTEFILCADDPGIASIGEGLPPQSVKWFGIDDLRLALPTLPHSADAGACRGCGGQIAYEAVLLGHLGHWHCLSCGRRRPSPAYFISKLDLRGAASTAVTFEGGGCEATVEIPLPGMYNAYNALAAWALSLELGLDAAVVSEGFGGLRPAFGRAERFAIDGREATLLLVKNPTGANEVIRTLVAEQGPLDLVVVLNDGIADGRDVSWIWDADFEDIVPSTARVCCSGTRAGELALRLNYAGIPRENLDIVVDPFEAVAESAATGSGRLWILPTYTALLELRSKLVSGGYVEPIA